MWYNTLLSYGVRGGIMSKSSSKSQWETLLPIFFPKSVAVIGASRTPGKIGYEIIDNLMKSRFTGKIFPINPKADAVHGIKAYPSILDIEDAIDLAIICIPKEYVFEAVDQCGQKGVKGLITITAGFRETGEKGLELEKQLIEKVETYGMRMIGPNCMGVINTHPDVRMNATFAYEEPLPGTIGFISQSGALGAAILSLARELNLGFSLFASIGNKANVSSNDLLELWERDERTKIILLYLENFGNPNRFTEIARRVTRKKPIIAVKSGRTIAGSRAAMSHTGAIAGADIASDALFEQCGVIRADSIEEMFDMAMAFISQPLPKGPRVAVLTNAGGPGIMATDMIVNSGLHMAELSMKTKETLRSFLPAEASVQNPIDMIASATTQDYVRALHLLHEDENVDSILIINVPPIMANPFEVAVEISHAVKGFRKPVVGCFMGVERIFRELQRKEVDMIPLYPFPETAVQALWGITRYAILRDKPMDFPERFDVDVQSAREILERNWEENRRVLPSPEVQRLLNMYGIPFAPSYTVDVLEDAIMACRKLGYPVVMKIVSEKLVHKSDVGAVITDIRNDTEAVDSFLRLKDITQKFELDDARFLIQRMIHAHTEIIVGASTDAIYGPLLMFGLGGIYVEVLKDVAIRVIPVTRTDVREMVRSIRAFPLLQGARGHKPVDIEIIEEVLLRIAQCMLDHPGIQEVEINPLLIGDGDPPICAVDARLILGNQPATPTWRRPSAPRSSPIYLLSGVEEKAMESGGSS